MPPLRSGICMGVDLRNHPLAPGLPPWRLGVDGLIDGALDEVVVGLDRVGPEVVRLRSKLRFEFRG